MGLVIVTPSRNEVKPTSWQVPRFEASAEERYAWVEEQLQEGEGWLEGQASYKNLPKNLRIFDAVFNDKTKSTLISNQLKYNIRKFVELISEVREIGTYGSDSSPYKPFTEMLNKVAKDVYLEAQYSRSIRKALQFSTVMGRGYIWPKCKAAEYGFGDRELIFQPLGVLDVVPVQIPSSNDVQDAYAVTVYEFMPIAEAHGRFPLFQSDLMPIADINYKSRVQARRADIAERWRYGDQTRNFGSLYCEIRYTYIRDIRINTTGYEMPMGDPGTSWFYKVPFVKQPIFGGFRDGKPYMREAIMEDCRVYPFLRLMITSPGMKMPMYDGPAFDWHGQIPVVQYDVDDWAWEGIGRSLVDDVGSIEQTKRKLERKIDQVISTSLNPPMGYDRSAVGGPKIENFDIFEENVRAGLDGEPSKVMQSLLPDSVKVTGEHFTFLEYLDGILQKQLGINDIANLENLKLNLSSDSLDKALEPIGPIAKGIAKGMEASNYKVAYMLKFMIPQWYDSKRIIEYVGPDNITPEVFDFDPASMIPSHMPEEYVNGMAPVNLSGPDANTPIPIPSQYSTVERMRRFTKHLRVIGIPNTLLKMTAAQEQLKFMTLKRQGAPISWSTVMKKLGVENFGEAKGNTEFEKWATEELEMLKLKIMAAGVMAQAGLGGEGGPGQGKGGGRPPSGKKSPRQYQKGAAGGEPRTGIKES